MSQDQLTPNELGKAVGEILREVTLGIGSIVEILKQQPGFDVAAYDNAVRHLLTMPDLPFATSEVLKSTIPD
jgi:hypothetical protein